MRIRSVGHALFAGTMVVLGILGLFKGDFTPVWAPVPKGVPARELLVWLCVCVSLASGIGLLVRRSAAIAARALFALLLLWWLLFRLPDVLRAPASQDSWSGAAETAVIVAAVWVLYAWFATEWDRRHLGFATGGHGQRGARVFYGLAQIPFGLAHFTYLNETVSLVPAWLPAHLFWAYFFGCTFLAAGVALLIGVYARLAAALSAVQLGLFTFLVWVPILAAGSKSAFQWSEAILSWALTSGAWVVADSYRDLPWLAVNRR
jgi:uncharacterized membrane protein